MAKNIGNNDIAKEFWENLADASALSEETKAALRAIIGAGTGEGGAMTGEEIAAALDTVLGSAEWRGGDTAMTGQAIEAVLDAFYMGTGWRTVLSPSDIVNAVNSGLGTMDWQTPVDFSNVSNVIGGALGNVWMMRAVERTPRENIYLRPADGAYNDLNYVNGNQANLGYLTWYNGGIVDGITSVDMTETNFTMPTTTWAFPTSVNLITASHITDSTFFEKIVEALIANPHWSKLPLTRYLDCSIVASSTGFYSPTVQGAIDSLIAQGWIIYTPAYNLPENPWVCVSNPGLSNAVLSGSGNTYAAQGDGGITLDGYLLYFCETNSPDPADWIPASAADWPLRYENYSLPSNLPMYATSVSGTFYVY